MAEATYSLSAVQERASVAIVAILAAYQVTPWLYELLPGGTRDRGHLAYGVGILRAVPQDPTDKQRAGSALNSAAEVGVRLMARLRPEAIEADYRTGLLAGDLVIAALINSADSSGSNAPQKWQWVSTAHRVAADGTHMLVEQRYTVRFQTALSL